MTDVEYLTIAVMAAQKSPDPSTQNAAVLVPRRGQAVIACNAPPERLRINEERLSRPAKYQFFEHAERSVILQAARQGVCTDGSVMYCPWYACPECARAILMAGVSEVVGLAALAVLTPDRWRADVKLGTAMLAEGGVKLRLYNHPIRKRILFDGASLRI